jgi:signal transduction histidine kinase
VDFSFPECRCGSVLDEGVPTVIAASDQRCALSHLHRNAKQPLTCHASAPLRARGRSLGVLSVGAGGVHAFDAADLDLLAAVGQQIGVALENARLWDELRQKERMRGELLAQAIRAQEEERRRVARELHDGIGQSLNALVFGLNAISTALDQGAPIVTSLVARLRLSASETVKELQEIIYDLRPSLLDDLGLCRALRWYAEERLRSRGVEVLLDVPEDAQRLPPEIETALFRIGQEAITNVNRHAHARRVCIRLQVDERQARMEIRDDGVGFLPGKALAASERRAWGLLGMQERAALLGGALAIESRPGQGACVRVTLPVHRREDA